ncbi:ATP-binding cassette domain-containing protein [Nocardia jinanensis]|uniref:ABC transporter domain-containing protein n=1 Tax=Nocardia jinanensis TaxID=382504 RepID=A0A917VUH9_9NOCA|nr:ATP-binding cassette domain-containing protein [Nocardia jinanensis]GGL15422.1 hypothetical protein GCM10011588_32520 [Nocardia jinanensis]
MPLLDVRSLSKTFPHGSASRPAVDDVSFTSNQGETLAPVGESGAGKSTTGPSLIVCDEPVATLLSAIPEMPETAVA